MWSYEWLKVEEDRRVSKTAEAEEEVWEILSVRTWFAIVGFEDVEEGREPRNASRL